LNKNNNNLILYEDNDLSIRPMYLKDYIGQTNTVNMLKIYINSALSRDESLDHTLLYGPPGLGKTTLANIIANEMNKKIISTTGSVIHKAKDLASILIQLEPYDILFIDEIHRIPKVLEEMLYNAMEDYELDIVVNEQLSSKTVKISLPPFTLVGATTLTGDISKPLRDRFGIILPLNYYNCDELSYIVKRTASVLGYNIDDQAANILASRSRGTPRIANKLFRRVRDFAQYNNYSKITYDITLNALNQLNIDNDGLDIIDNKYLNCLINTFNGGPVGINAIAATLGLDTYTLIDVNEPYLLQAGFIIRSRKGRIATDKAYKHINKKEK